MTRDVGDTRQAGETRRIGALIIGDEILSGKRQDKHLVKLIEILAGRGLALSWARYLGDDQETLADALEQSFAASDLVFSFGGIGATPDDVTRQAAAQALRRPLLLHPDAARLIAERCAEAARQGQGSADMTLPENRQRLKMGEFPEGATIIPNGVNRIPGFGVDDHWFVPGFPVMAWPMVAWVLDTHYRHLFHRAGQRDLSLRVFGTAEAAVTPLLEAIEAAHAGVKVYSLPSIGEGGERRHIELGVKGFGPRVEDAFVRLRDGIAALGSEFEEVPRPVGPGPTPTAG